MSAVETTSAGAGRIVHLLFGIVVAAGFMLPIAWLIAGSLRPGSEIFTSLDPLSIGSFIPPRPTLENFGSALGGSFRTGLINSFVVAGCTVVVALLVCAAAAFALSAMQWRGRDVVFALIVFSFLIPEEVVAIPLSAIFAQGGLQNTYTALIVPFVGNGMVIFLLRQFFLAIPRSLIEAAQIDGAGWLRIFLEIFLPLSRPALIAAGVIIFNGQWQAYLWPLLVTTRQDMFLAPITLALMVGENITDYGKIFAASTILSLIPAVILLGFQRFFIDSVAMSGVKE
ncbi:MAG: carbohydrate ABC transporter permease [Mesorhizobium sp.]|uniref:carbohydrate ABC transporter permease n=1 Tax=Mesorhizobium sp. TaxID=1871066 RepID=UPI0011F64262|nr:carbohydrate ABC transporter permease [Mesorhizobium sp.]TIP69622.1 MAG: carbohydrate ABC transporter permease [Mesorhizobium sp.]TIR47530.1 MAG: carbohydrate ABC transporter permease [Mesorhizobium sp.]TJV93364.1 MAG: carbohydrate ABC transporter permease [Mesorhizobium sp.]